VFVDLVDALRCPRPHAESWLVAAAYRTQGRVIVEGTLGCPECGAEYPIHGGVAHFGAADLGEPGVVSTATGDTVDPEARAGEAMRLAALLHLDGPGGLVVLGGGWGAVADALLELVEARLVLVEPPGEPVPREPVAAVRGAWLPVAGAQARGVALDAATAEPERLAAAVRALRPRGRLVAPAGAALPEGVRELARDARHWVAERDAVPASGIVQLGRR
jgi:uncharacterized protein YbaR (Trm112 family)